MKVVLIVVDCTAFRFLFIPPTKCSETAGRRDARLHAGRNTSGGTGAKEEVIGKEEEEEV